MMSAKLSLSKYVYNCIILSCCLLGLRYDKVPTCKEKWHCISSNFLQIKTGASMMECPFSTWPLLDSSLKTLQVFNANP